jgi:hypothetical protein
LQTATPNLEPDTVRKYVAEVEGLGLVETVKTKREIFLARKKLSVAA